MKRLLLFVSVVLAVIGLNVQPAGAQNQLQADVPWIPGMTVQALSTGTGACTMGFPLYYQWNGQRTWYFGSSGTCEYVAHPFIQDGYRFRPPTPSTNWSTFDAIGGWVAPNPDYTLHAYPGVTSGAPLSPLPSTMKVKEFCPWYSEPGATDDCQPTSIKHSYTRELPVTGAPWWNLVPGQQTICYSGDNRTYCTNNWYFNGATGEYMIAGQVNSSFVTTPGMRGAPMFLRVPGSTDTALGVGQIGRCVTPFNAPPLEPGCQLFSFNFMSQINAHQGTGWLY